MKKYYTLLLPIVGLGFSYGVRPAFSFDAGWAYIKPEGYNGNHFLELGIGTTVPYSRYIGLSAGIFWIDIDLSESGTILGTSSRIGLIEMIPTKNVSPYFTQHIILDHISGGGISATNFGIGVGIGIEFLSSSYVSPKIGGGFTYSISSMDGFSSSLISFGASFGVRFSWIR